MCDRYRMSAKLIDRAQCYGVEPLHPEAVNFPPGVQFTADKISEPRRVSAGAAAWRSRLRPCR